jgi:hypothetical protein
METLAKVIFKVMEEIGIQPLQYVTYNPKYFRATPR